MAAKRRPKIVVIGAAGSSFTGLPADLISAPDLNGAQLALVDIDADGLAISGALGKRMAQQWRKGNKITATTVERLCADPLTTSIPHARECMAEMFAVQAEHLPGYE